MRNSQLFDLGEMQMSQFPGAIQRGEEMGRVLGWGRREDGESKCWRGQIQLAQEVAKLCGATHQAYTANRQAHGGVAVGADHLAALDRQPPGHRLGS